jgi:hypothetical protein
MKQITLEALGAEKGAYLSHALDKVWLQNGVQGEGETFLLESRPNGRVALACTGGEKGKYLSHAFAKLWLQNGVQGEGEEWIMHDKGNGNVAFECLGKEVGLFLSHAFNKMWLQNGYQGEGELWHRTSIGNTHETQDVFSGGYYNIDIPGLGWAQHTYVIAKPNTPDEVKFQCYGGTDTDHKLEGSIYPGYLYKPAIFPPYTRYGTQINGDLRLARGIACGDPYAAPRNNYDLKTGGPYLLGDNCGLIYAVNGVCHHMEARIFWACDNTPIVWPSSATASFWVWYDIFMGTGFYGNTWHIWKPVFEEMKKRTKLRSISDETSMRELIKNGVNEKLRQVDIPEFHAALSQIVPVSEKDLKMRKATNAIPDQMHAFHLFKNELDKQLLKGTISKDEYAQQVNKKFHETMTELANYMSSENFKDLFGMDPGSEVNLGIDPNKISDNLADFKLID